MQVLPHPQGLEVILFPAELLLFRNILARILGHYRDHPAGEDRDLPKPYADMDEEEWKEWREELRHFKGANQVYLEQWLGQLPPEIPHAEQPRSWIVTHKEIDPLLMILNDHRLMLAETHDIDDHLMEADVTTLENAELQQALVEIHLLAWLIETILQAKSAA